LVYTNFPYHHCPKPENFILPAGSFSKEVPIGLLLALYREGMNSLDMAYRYISFFKIYEAWYKNYFAFRLTDNQLQKLKLERPVMIIKKELFEYPSNKNSKIVKHFFDREFNDKSIFKELFHFRNLLAHYLLDRHKDLVPHPHFISFDDLDVQQQIEDMTNLIERMATYILVIEFDLLAKCDEDFSRLFFPYRGLFKFN